MSTEPIVKKRVAVVGSRTFADKAKLYEVLTKNFDRIRAIVSGGAKGADSLAVEWATDYGIPYLVFPALWRDPFTGVYNKGAGFRRNRQIVEHADVVVAFWDGESAGTAHTIEMARQLNKSLRIIKFSVPPPTVIDTVDLHPEPAHCCTPEAKQAQHDFEAAQREQNPLDDKTSALLEKPESNDDVL